MNKMIFMKIGWMAEYSGPGRISGGGKYVAIHGYGHEIMNFKPFAGKMYGTAVIPCRPLVPRHSVTALPKNRDELLPPWPPSQGEQLETLGTGLPSSVLFASLDRFLTRPISSFHCAVGAYRHWNGYNATQQTVSDVF